MDELICGMTPEEVAAEAAEAERETAEDEAKRVAAREASLKAMTKDQRYYARNVAKRMADSAAHRAGDAVPPWLTPDQKQAIIAIYQETVDAGDVTRVPHAADHVVPLVGYCRKTWRATGNRNQVVCGLHVPWNLRSIPHSINRDIKGEWFYSDWPVEVDPTYNDSEDFPW